MSYIPLGKNILVKEIKVEQTTSGGLLIPEAKGNRLLKKVEVVAVPNILNTDEELRMPKVSDVVLLDPLNLKLVEPGLWLVEERDVLAVVKE